MLRVSNDDPGQDARSPYPAVRPPGTSSSPPGWTGPSRNATYLPETQLEEVGKLAPPLRYLSVMHADMFVSYAKPLVEALEVEVERLCWTTVITSAALQRIADSQAAYLTGGIFAPAAITFLTPCDVQDEARCLAHAAAATASGATTLFGSFTEIGEAPAELQDVSIDLMRTWSSTLGRFPGFG